MAQQCMVGMHTQERKSGETSHGFHTAETPDVTELAARVHVVSPESHESGMKEPGLSVFGPTVLQQHINKPQRYIHPVYPTVV